MAVQSSTSEVMWFARLAVSVWTFFLQLHTVTCYSLLAVSSLNLFVTMPEVGEQIHHGMKLTIHFSENAKFACYIICDTMHNNV